MLRIFALLAFILFSSVFSSAARVNQRPIRIAVLDFGASGRRFADRLAETIATEARKTRDKTESNDLLVIDRDQARAAALGAGYRGSLNMALQEARDLGSAIGCDFFFAGDAETVRRSPSNGPAYFESFAAIYLVSARTGRLILWERPSAQGASLEEAERRLLHELTAKDAPYRYGRDIQRALEDERAGREQAIDGNAPVVDAMSDDNGDANNRVRAPRPYVRLKPPYPETAARAEIEATVDVLVDVDAHGEVGRVEIARWAGYGLDQSVVDTVRQLHFFPAQRDRVAIPLRVLLRYNFRKPPK